MFQGFVFGINDVYGHEFSAVSLPEVTVGNLTEKVDDTAVFSTDEFRMYSYKIQRCPRNRSHDWTECPYAHRGEKAQRRDPRRFNYTAVACPAFRSGSCPKGDFCEFAHGVFEYWLHPARYRTRACNAGRFCQRKVCFFAHSPEELRPETKHKFNLNAQRQRVAVAAVESPPEEKNDGILEIPARENGGGRKNERSFGFDVSELELPHIEWISELLK
ncbi:zinc finger CCCH domain-containing protein 54 [Cucumis melo var. makuwa]|uniref:Zinc finger CCCH domain-containing protein 54 n=2 Tax=Cucumis melo TaxID=3656 RepID=A0A1S3BYP8_CUCME|nr:zinc finger CCCH domain-containing protein 54 [Cucumis melo]KAA0044676.1 zinc finger CCCH domain-containing protein 54 [Cucumis melo var. makuwa]TYK16906.1 zinc finger CCCH domain-containing protein 54 [Cucumis melo var. makuwa]